MFFHGRKISIYKVLLIYEINVTLKNIIEILVRNCVNAKIMHFYAECFQKNALFFNFVVHPWDANLETYSHRFSFMGPLQNFG